MNWKKLKLSLEKTQDHSIFRWNSPYTATRPINPDQQDSAGMSGVHASGFELWDFNRKHRRLLLSNIRYIDSGVISPWGSTAPHLRDQQCGWLTTIAIFPSCFLFFVLLLHVFGWRKKMSFIIIFFTWKTPWRRSHSRVAQRCRHTPHWLKLLLMCRSLNRQKNNIHINIYTKIYMNKQTHMHMF